MKRSSNRPSLLATVLVAAVVPCWVCQPSFAEVIAMVNVDGHEFPLVQRAEGDAMRATYAGEMPGEWRIDLDVLLDPDPMIAYSGSVIDFGGPSNFSLMFSQNIVATSAPGIASHSHSSSTTNGQGANTPVTALAPPAGVPEDSDGTTEIAVYTLSTDGGANLLSADLDLSPSFVGSAPSDTQGPFAEGPIAGPATAGNDYDFMRVDINFGLAGGNDAYTFNGIATIVPEPGTISLLLAGAVMVAGIRWRRRRGAVL